MLSKGHTQWPILVAISAAMHLLGFWLASGPTSTQTPRSSSVPFVLVPIEVSSVHSTRPVSPPPALPRPTARAPADRRQAAAPHRAASDSPSSPPRAAAAAAAAAPSATLSESPSAPRDEGAWVAQGDAPRADPHRLTPRLEAVIGLEGGSIEPPRGSTLQNGPGEVVDQAIAREVEGEQLTRRLNADLLADVGAAAIGAGTVPGHFRRAESSLRALFASAEVDRTPLTAKQIVEDVAKTMFSSGVSESAARKVSDSPLGQSVRNQTVSVPNTDDNRFREQGLQLMAGVEALKERARAARLKTVLQLTTDPSGAVADVTVLEHSGDPRFDESVLHLSRKVFRRLPEDDEKALGSNWWQTKWQFTWEPPDVRVRLLDAHRVPPAP